MVSEKLNGREVHGIIIVLASVIVHIPVAGIINSFGVFVEQFNNDFCPFDCLQLLGWIGALTFGLNRAFCWMVMELQAIISPALLFALGVLMCAISLFLTSLADRLPWLFLFYCLIYGFGSSLVMNTPYALIEDIFPSTHRYHVTSTSIMNVGAPLGMLLVNPLVAYLDTIEEHTWRDTMRVFSVVVLITGLICTLPMSANPWYLDLWRACSSKNIQSGRNGYEDLDKETSDNQITTLQEETTTTESKNTDALEIGPTEGTVAKRPSFDDGYFEIADEKVQEPVDSKGSSFVILCGQRTLTNIICWTIGMFFLSVAIFIPKVHFIQYMHDLNIDPETAAACMSYEGLAEAILSFMISVMGDPISPYFLWMFALCTGVLAVSSSILVMSTRVIHIAIYCTIHGAVDGLLMTTLYPTLPLFVKGTKAKQALWSLTLFVTGIGQVVGLPMAGLVYDETQSYQLVFFIAAGVFGTAAIAFLFIACRIPNTGVVTEEDVMLKNRGNEQDNDEQLVLNKNNDVPSKEYSSTCETPISKDSIPADNSKEGNGLPCVQDSGKTDTFCHTHAPSTQKSQYLTIDSKRPQPGTLLYAAMQGKSTADAKGKSVKRLHYNVIENSHHENTFPRDTADKVDQRSKVLNSTLRNDKAKANTAPSSFLLDSDHGTKNDRLTEKTFCAGSICSQESAGANMTQDVLSLNNTKPSINSEFSSDKTTYSENKVSIDQHLKTNASSIMLDSTHGTDNNRLTESTFCAGSARSQESTGAKMSQDVLILNNSNPSITSEFSSDKTTFSANKATTEQHLKTNAREQPFPNMFSTEFPLGEDQNPIEYEGHGTNRNTWSSSAGESQPMEAVIHSNAKSLDGRRAQ